MVVRGRFSASGASPKPGSSWLQRGRISAAGFPSDRLPDKIAPIRDDGVSRHQQRPGFRSSPFSRSARSLWKPGFSEEAGLLWMSPQAVPSQKGIFMVAPEISKYLSNWKHDPWAMRALFDETEFSSLETSRRQVRKDRRTIAVCFYENFFGRAGGLFAVARFSPKTLQQRGEKVLVLSLFHANLATAPSKPSAPRQTAKPSASLW